MRSLPVALAVLYIGLHLTAAKPQGLPDEYDQDDYEGGGDGEYPDDDSDGPDEGPSEARVGDKSKATPDIVFDIDLADLDATTSEPGAVGKEGVPTSAPGPAIPSKDNRKKGEPKPNQAPKAKDQQARTEHKKKEKSGGLGTTEHVVIIIVSVVAGVILIAIVINLLVALNRNNARKRRAKHSKKHKEKFEVVDGPVNVKGSDFFDDASGTASSGSGTESLPAAKV